MAHKTWVPNKIISGCTIEYYDMFSVSRYVLLYILFYYIAVRTTNAKIYLNSSSGSLLSNFICLSLNLIFKHPLLYTRIQLILRRRATIRKLSFVKCGISCDNHFKFKERNEMIGFE